MESNVHTYQLTQKNKVYILTTSVVGNDIKISVKNKSDSQGFTRVFTIETWKKIGAVFESIQSALDAIQWIDKTLKVHKVKVVEVGSMVKLVFFIIENRTKHLVEIPLSESAQINTTVGTTSTSLSSQSVVNTNVDTSSFTTGKVIGTNKDTTTFNTGDLISSKADTTSYNAGAIMGTQSQFLQQGAATTTTTTTTTTEVNFSREIGLDPSKIVKQTVNENTQEIINSIEEEKKLRLSQVGKITTQPSTSGAFQEVSQFQTTDYKIPEPTTNIATDSVNLNQFTSTTSVALDLPQQYTPTTETQDFNTQGFSSSQTNYQEYQASTTPAVNTQYTETNTQISNIETTPAFRKITTETTTSGDFQEASQFQTTDYKIPEPTTNIATDSVNLNQFTSTTSGALDLPQQYTPTTETQDFNTQGFSSSQTNYQEYQASTTPAVNTQYTETNTQISNVQATAPVTPNYGSLPYITPVDEETPIVNTEIKAESNPVDINLQNFNKNYNNEINYEQYQTTTSTTTNTQFDNQNKIQDDRLIKLEGDTNTLKNEHQEIQSKLSNLFTQVNSYKSQLESMERENNSRELSNLRAENAAMKQQLSELNSLRNEAAQVQILRNQVAEIDPLRRKAAQLDSLRGQLNELNMLKAKVAELSGMEGQLRELNNLKAQIHQMNLAQQNVQYDEKEMLKRKLQELENLKTQYEQEIRTLKGNKTTVTQESSGLEKTQHLFEEKTQQISVKGDIIHNTEELEFITRKINKSNKKIILNLLYKASVDSDKAKAFHEKCDMAQSSLVLVETDKGKRFGGFTTCSWAGECEEKKDEDAFVFSLDKMMIYENIPGEDAIGCYPKFGPIFLGCQIRIYDNAFSKGGTTFEKGLNYNTEEDYELTGGDRIFKVKEIEVYEVIAQ